MHAKQASQPDVVASVRPSFVVPSVFPRTLMQHAALLLPKTDSIWT